MKTRHLLSLLSLGLTLGLTSFIRAAAPTVPTPEITKLTLRPNGTFTFDSIRVFAGHFAPDWKHRIDQTDVKSLDGYPKRTATGWETQAPFLPEGATVPITLSERLAKIDASTFNVTYDATHPTGVATQEMFLQFEIPLAIGSGKSVMVDSVAHALPPELKEGQLFVDHELTKHTLVIPGASGTVTIEGTFRVVVQDQRQWKCDVYSVRLRFEPADEMLTQAGLEAKLHYTPRK
ncbi:MAG: hypothetical protein WC205_02655 [Opitutaceae bacterium]|jgi:hypothetical protein